MPLSTTKKLFRMLRPYHPEIPKDPRTLLQTPRTCISKPLNKGNYVHLGLERGLQDQLHSLPETTVPEMHIQLHIDGMKIFKGSSQGLWPILARVRHPVVGQPFIVGVFSGPGKPDPLDDFLGDCVGELKDLLASGLRIPHTQNSVKVVLDNVICDTPARCFVRQVKAHNGYYGCDRNKVDFLAEQMVALNNSVRQLQATMTDAVSALERGATAADVGPSRLHLPLCTDEAYEDFVRRLTTEAELADKALAVVGGRSEKDFVRNLLTALLGPPLCYTFCWRGGSKEKSESLFTPPDYDFDEGPKIESVSFDEATVRKELMTLNESKSPGPDDIPPKLLKELAAELAKPLSMLFQASFEAGCLPADWKSARITPLHKGGSKASANNYRPISLTSICCKLMEKIIKRELMRFLEQHNLLSDAQHGFRTGRSCVTNLLNCLERWTRSVDEGNALHVVYIDFKKAFDSVPHQRLLHKLSRIGVRGNLLKWIQSFLLDRCQTVHVGGQQSTEVTVESGVPQGSVLGPTLFIIYVNDCVSELDCGVAMFADDIKLWSVIRTADDEEHLQANLNRLQQWSKDWLLPFNEKKCNILRVGRARSPNHMAYCLNGIPLQEVDSQKDLGVWITTSLKPSLHCTKIAKSAMSVLYLVKRTFSAFDEDCFAKVFRTFVRPQLEFAIQAWRPWTAKDISILERVQRRATKLVAGQGSLPYATRLANLDLFPLSYRQLRGDLIQAFRIIRGQDCSLVPGTSSS
ncbi:hypothetical protein SprV_0200622600 [Sparganum proliferum]